MEGIQVSVSKTGLNNDISVIKVGGYIDTTTSAEVERTLDSLLKEGSNKIIIDLGNVDYISSAGWGIFISEIKGIREKKGDLKLVNMIPDVYEVFELLEFHYILKAFDNVEDAVNDFEQSTSGTAETPVSNTDQQDKISEGEEDEIIEEDTSPTYGKQSAYEGQAAGSLDDKITKIIMQNPDISIGEIKKTLNTEIYDFVEIGFLELWKRLRKMGLISKKKRVDYFKKHAFQS